MTKTKRISPTARTMKPRQFPNGTWGILDCEGNGLLDWPDREWPDPVTAVDEAIKWLKRKAQRCKLPRITEAAFMDQVVQLARYNGWNRIAHFRPAQTSRGWRTACQYDAKGWPDLVMIRGDRMLVVELKRNHAQKTTWDQIDWLNAFKLVGIPAYTWTPDDWPEIQRVLR